MINIKKILFILRKVVYAFLLLFSLNISMKSLGIYIPINIANVAITTVLGIPGLLSIFIVRLLMY